MREPETPLEAELRRRIALVGPMTVAEYMSLCLGHPQFGYYPTRDPLGAAGDFTTAPEVSQMFGELIGLWVAEVWHLMNRPATLHLIELGPGRGTLMADALRALQKLPALRACLTVHLVETSPVLRKVQQDRLQHAEIPIAWHETLASVPAGPSILIGNEFLDALPIRQFERRGGAWHERLIGMDGEGRLCFGLSEASIPLALQAAEGAILETSPAQEFFIADGIAARFEKHEGAALFIDYGTAEPEFGVSLQAVSRHSKVSLFFRPGQCDLTAHVPFGALAETARRHELKVHGPVTQRAFLASLGIAQRAETLYKVADAAGKDAIAAAFDRLTDAAPDGMGQLFKAIAFSSRGLTQLPGLSEPHHAKENP